MKFFNYNCTSQVHLNKYHNNNKKKQSPKTETTDSSTAAAQTAEIPRHRRAVSTKTPKADPFVCLQCVSGRQLKCTR